MTSVNAEGNSSKSKFLAPLVILLLCGAAMTGAAFAYNASLNGNTDVPTDSFVIQFDGEKTDAQLELPKDFKLNFDSVNDPASHTVKYKLSADNVKPTFKLFGKDQNGNAKAFTVTEMTVSIFDKAGNEVTKLKATAVVTSGANSSEQTVTITFEAGKDVTFTKEEIQNGFVLKVSIDAKNFEPKE